MTRPRRILFDHLPKCGGSALNVFLEAHYPARKIFSTNGSHPIESVNAFKNLPERARYRFDLVQGHNTNELLDFVHPECLKITVLRDPVDRIVSHYYYVKKTPAHYLHARVHDAKLSLEEYAGSGLSDELRNWYTCHFSRFSVKEAEARPEEAISRAYKVIVERYDIVGFIDDFLTFIEKLRKQANLQHQYRNEKINVTEGKPKTDSLPSSVLNTIEQVNSLDVALYRKVRDKIG